MTSYKDNVTYPKTAIKDCLVKKIQYESKVTKYCVLVRFGGIEYSYPQEGVFGCNVFSFGIGAVGVFMIWLVF